MAAAACAPGVHDRLPRSSVSGQSPSRRHRRASATSPGRGTGSTATGFDNSSIPSTPNCAEPRPPQSASPRSAAQKESRLAHNHGELQISAAALHRRPNPEG